MPPSETTSHLVPFLNETEQTYNVLLLQKKNIYALFGCKIFIYGVFAKYKHLKTQIFHHESFSATNRLPGKFLLFLPPGQPLLQVKVRDALGKKMQL